MTQNIKRSWKEAGINILIGYSINYLANILILPLFGFHSLTLGKNFIIGLIYTGISLMRMFIIRRVFNKGDI